MKVSTVMQQKMITCSNIYNTNMYILPMNICRDIAIFNSQCSSETDYDMISIAGISIIQNHNGEKNFLRPDAGLYTSFRYVMKATQC